MTMRSWTELNPTGELRDWQFIGPTVYGKVYDHPHFDNGFYFTLASPLEKRDYKDHWFFVTPSGEHFKAMKIEEHIKGY